MMTLPPRYTEIFIPTIIIISIAQSAQKIYGEQYRVCINLGRDKRLDSAILRTHKGLLAKASHSTVRNEHNLEV